MAQIPTYEPQGRRFNRLSGLLLVGWIGLVGADENSSRAAAVVERLHQTLVAAMQDGEALGFHGRYEFIAPVVEAGHDFEAIARLTLQPAWRELDASQRRVAVEAIRHLSIATYANRFARYGGERFVMLDADATEGQAQVTAQLVTASGGEVIFEYLLAQERGEFRIVNILVDGVSDLALRRAEYARLLREQNFGGLLEELAAQADAMATGPATGRP